ncbi:MAG: enoyl-CoA hydratase/isomerase family protein [Tuberibacillus sp.]
MDKVIFRKEDSMAWFILNRPEKRNAIDYDVMDEFKRRLAEVQSDSNIKCLVITGSGSRAFCSGGDLSEFHRLKTEKEAKVMLGKMGQILYQLFTLPKPTVALLNGTAVGGGCEIASACDFRIAMPHVKIGFIQGALGITTGWGGSAFLFERLQAQDALALLMSARKWTAEEALKKGFIHKILPDSLGISADKVKALIHEIVPLSSPVLSAYKNRYLDSVDLTRLRLNLEKEMDQCARLWGMEEHEQAVRQFLNK